MDYRTDIISGIVLSLFAVFYFINAFSIRVYEGLGKAIVDSSTLPKIWGILLFLLSLNLLIRGLRKKKEAQAAGVETKRDFDLKKYLTENYAVYGTFVLIAIYVTLLRRVGFIIMTAFYIFFQIQLLTHPKERRYALPAAIAVVTSLFIYFVFVKVFYVILPGGLLPL